MDSPHLISALAVCGLLIFAGLIARLFFARRPRALPYERAGRLSVPAEPSFLSAFLQEVLGQQYCILGNVCLADVIAPCGDLPYPERTAALDRVLNKQVDFAVCDPETREIVGVIELDDAAPARVARKRGDAFLLAALEAAGIPLACLRAQTPYAPEEVRQRVMDAFASARTR